MMELGWFHFPLPAPSQFLPRWTEGPPRLNLLPPLCQADTGGLWEPRAELIREMVHLPLFSTPLPKKKNQNGVKGLLGESQKLLNAF